ncbi:transposase [Fructobacillus fructosus]|nr:transposase [Fructobacillus fructosus]
MKIYLRQIAFATPIPRKGPYDNARIEAFHSILKRKLIYPNRFKSKFELVARISRYIHRYNHERIHTYESSLAM